MKVANILVSSLLCFNAIESSKIERVLFIGLDGAGNFYQQIETPNIHKLLASGAYTSNAQAMKPTWSGQNWGSMLTGVTPERHGVTNGNINDHYYNKNEYPTVFKTILNHDPNATIASIVSWAPLNKGLTEEGLKLDKVTSNDTTVFTSSLDYITTRGKNSKFMFVYFGDIDETGHSKGWLSKEYIAEYKLVDSYIGKILAKLEEAKLRDSTLILMTADHGGVGKGHGGNSKAETQVLFGASGPGISPKKLDNSVRNMDIFAITLKALNIPLPSYIDSEVPRKLFD
ncbi:alkaline phosphatase-like protein [Neoconidiobolus thromboides FSU 785]|nr:alkaline phosphatase-like protein [Neoconidiobolus thromboides FSU 785]